MKSIRRRLQRAIDGRFGRLPDFVIIGAQRCGTSSLYAYLTQHSQIAPARRKEAHYFDLNYTRDINWYRAHFPADRTGHTLIGESSPYYLFHPHAAERMAQLLPDVKLIVLLRDPVARAVSQFKYNRKKGRESLTLADALAAESKRLENADIRLNDPAKRNSNHQHYSYAARGHYADQISVWQRHFQASQFLFLFSNNLFDEPQQTVDSVVNFLGLSPEPIADVQPRNSTQMTTSDEYAIAHSRLAMEFAPSNDQLGQSLNRPIPWT